MKKIFYSLSSITKRIQDILQPHIGKLFWVKAEISSGRERGGSFYCDLVETDETGKIIAKMKCSIWNSDLSRIRKQFKEPRIHFALNCASTSCPFLPSDLFTSQNLHQRLEDLTFDFINNQGGVQIVGQNLILSRIFKWYRKDFKQTGGILSFVRDYWKGKEPLPDNPKIKFAYYQWAINAKTEK